MNIENRGDSIGDTSLTVTNDEVLSLVDYYSQINLSKEDDLFYSEIFEPYIIEPEIIESDCREELFMDKNNIKTNENSNSNWLNNLFNSPLEILRSIINSPNFSTQAIVIALTLLSENLEINEKINNMNSTVTKVKGVTDKVTNTMESIKFAIDGTSKIRNLFK